MPLFTTLRPHERVALWNPNGTVRFVNGPRRLFTAGRRVQRLTRPVAGPDQYLAIEYRDGRVAHLPGPVALFEDPVRHDRVRPRDQITVAPDEAVVVEDQPTREDGKADPDAPVTRRVVRGPARFVPAPTERVKPIGPPARYTAAPGQYLAVRFHGGRTEHRPGPAELWLDPEQHAAVTVREAIPVDANEALVAYRPAAKDVAAAGPAGEVQRTVLRGPVQHVPAPDGWLHTFRWHGADPKNPRHKIPRALTFQKLRVIPDQMYVDVTDVRTADDALLTVQAMLFFELVDIERMLDQTHDPVADFVNAVTADVIDFAAARLF